MHLVSQRAQLMRRVVRLRCSPKFNDVVANPLGQFRLRAVPRCRREHRSDYVRLVSHKIETVQAKEHDHCEECYSLVAVAIWMIVHNTVSVCCSQARKIRTPLVRPFVSRSSKSRFQEPVVPKAGEAAMFSNLIQVYRVNDHALNPPRFGRLHRLLGQLAESAAVAFRGASSNCERFLCLGIIRREKNPVFGFDSQKSVARCYSEAISHVFRKSGANGAADSSYSDFFDHMPCFVGAV